MFFKLCVLVFFSSVSCQYDTQYCLADNTDGCELGRPPRYMVLAPKRVRPEQVYQVHATLIRLEARQKSISFHISILRNDVEEIASSALNFDRPSSRIIQLLIPGNAEPGRYKLRVEGRLNERIAGNVFVNETLLDYDNKHASMFIQMSQPIYKQEQKVHFRIIPIKPDMMPKYGTMNVYIEDPTGFPVRRWLAMQPNAGGVISLNFQLSDQPNYGTWHIRVQAFSHTYRQPFKVEEFWEPRFDVNVSVPSYMMDTKDMVVKGTVMVNQTSGRACKGNATISAFFRPSESLWNSTKGWEKPYLDGLAVRSGFEMDTPTYQAARDVPVKDYHLYFQYEYRFIEYFEGRIDFEWTRKELLTLAERSGIRGDTLANSEVVFFVNVTDWYSSLNRTGWAGTQFYSSGVKMKWIGGPVRTFKPETMLKVQVAVSRYDGTPVPNGGAVKILPRFTPTGGSDTPVTKTVINGVAEFEFRMLRVTTSFILTASYIDVRSSFRLYDTVDTLGEQVADIEMRGTKYYSPTDSYISLTTSTAHPKVNEYMVFHVLTSHFIPRIYYQIISQANIIDGDTLEMTSRQKTFALAMSREMVPTCRVLVYYIREPEEIVSDVLSFFVNATRHNEVKLGINRGKDFSRDTVEFNAYADPGSYVAFSGMLLDLYSKGLSDGITEYKLIDELNTFDEPAWSTFKHLWRTSDTDFQYQFYHGSDPGYNGNSTFDAAGLVVLTDADVVKLDNDEPCRDSGSLPCFSNIEAECYAKELRCNGKYDGCPTDGADEWGCPEEDRDDIQTSVSPINHLRRIMRYYDNSTWAWQEIFVKPDGRVDFRVDVPKHPLTWVINGFSMSRDLGLGLMMKPLRFDTVRYMYMMVEHPKTIHRGEQIGVRITVFNYWYEDDYLEIAVKMHAGKTHDFVLVGDMGYVTAFKPDVHKGDHTTLLFLEPGQSQDIYMPIVSANDLPYEVDELNFVVSASCFMQKNEYKGTMKLLPNGVSNYYHTPFMIDLIRYPSIKMPEFKINVPEKFRKPEVRDNLFVPGSRKATSYAFGDVAMPGFYEDYLNAQNILYRPYGSAEMVTFNMAYNLLSLWFQERFNQQFNEHLQLDRTLTVLNEALQRMMSYMNKDGSFSMFREDKHPSLWLTAFVGKTLSKAALGLWEQKIFIPRDLMAKIVEYICSRQNKTTGAFDPDEFDLAYDRKMASLQDQKTNKMMAHKIPLTAYVLIALHDMTEMKNFQAPCLEEAKTLAASYLASEAHTLGADNIYFLAITTYALTLSQQSERTFNKLWSLKRNDSDSNYFADDIVYANPSRFQNNVRYLKPRQELMNDAYAVQSTSYALLAGIRSGQAGRNDRAMMVTWINSMRNSFAGFSSTQDTITAMEALVWFTREDMHRNEFDLEINIQSSSAGGWSVNFNLQKSEFARLHFASLPAEYSWGYFRPQAQGVGRGMLQVTTTLNVEYKNRIKTQQRFGNNENNNPIPFFDLEVQTLKWSGRNESIMEMTSCVSWVYTDRSLTSGLSVLEVDIPSGFVVMNDTLRDYVRSNTVPNLRRAEFYQNRIYFYFDYLDQSKSCVYFRADRWYPVANTTREHKIRVYDYYEPGMHQTTLYRTETLFRMNICFACGSYQCPYCPYFNVSNIARTGLLVTIVIMLLAFIIQKYLLRPR